MTLVLVAITSLIAATLTFFCGFGLGTILMPVATIFFPVEVAISITAIVHLANNLFKAGLVVRYASWSISLRFGIPALFASFLGAVVLLKLGALPTAYEVAFMGVSHQVSAVKFVTGVVILAFTLLEIIPSFNRMTVGPRYLLLGGILSGFFGGLSGLQGALRSMFLLKAGLSKQAFVGTGALIAVLVDIARLSVYGWTTTLTGISEPVLVGVACVSAFVGSFFGSRLIQKVTYRGVQLLVSVMLVAISFALLMGLV